MKKWRLLLFTALVGLLAAIAMPDHSQETQQVFAGPLEDGSLVVRVYFDDLVTARQIAISFEPLESDYDKGYLLLAVNGEELAQLEASGLQFEVDEALTAFYAPDNNLAPVVPGIQAIPGFSCYRTVEETFATAASLAANYPTLAAWTDVGNSWEKTNGLDGYDMQVLKLTNTAVPGPKPIIFITSAIHAREYTTAELTTRLAEFLVTNYGTDADATWILDYHEIHFMLHANPDGRKYAESGLLWRKNTNQNYCSPTSNSRGADLNRNFPYNWGCCGGSSGSQCSETYRGASAASEPETQAVVNYILANFDDNRGPGDGSMAPLDTEGIYLDIHSSGRLLLWPWGHTSTPAPNGTQLQTLGRKLAYFNGHTPQQSIGLYPTDGTTTSFAYGDRGIAAFTYELGTEFFESCSYFENTLLPDNMASLQYALKVVRSPYITPAGPDAINVALDFGAAAPGVPAGTTINLSASIDDGRFNNSNGTEPTQNIAAAEYYLDAPPWDGGTAVPMSASDGSFNSSVEGASASIDTTGMSDGQHILYVRGQDASGNWGAVSAVFLYLDDDAPPPPSTIFFDDFESNLGWTTNPSGTDTATTGQWERADPQETSSSGVKQLGTTVSGNNDLVTGPLAGSSVGSYDIDNGVTTIRSPNINLPASSDIDLSFSYYLAHLNNATSADFLRVSLVSSSATVLLEELGNGDNDNAAWVTFSTDITAFAGQTVYLLLEAADAGSGSLVEAAVDDVRITAADSGPTPTPTNTPIPPTPTNTPTATATATVSPTPLPPTATPTTGPTSTATNTPLPTSTNTPLPTATNTPVLPTATNTPVPTATATATASPTPAPPTPTPTTPPGGILFFDDFESNQDWIVNPNGTDTATTGQWERANPEQTSSSGVKQLGATVSGSNDLVTGALAGSGAGSFDIDNGVTSIRSPNISLPTGLDLTLSFSYYLAHLNNATSADFLRVTAVGSSSQVLFEELGAGNDDDAVWDTASVSLNAFAGQTIYLLVEAADAGGGSLVEAGIDDVEITAGAAPSCVTYTSSDVPIALPNGTSSISSQLTIGAADTIDDLDVDIDMDHVWVGDLSMVLTHQSTGRAVTLIDRPGVPASTYGCSGDNILATLSDEAALQVENQCSGTPTINGTFSPNAALSAFDGESSSGTWQLTVTDSYTSADAGTLNGWSITICSP